MIDRVPGELMVKFMTRHPSAKVLEYKENDYEFFFTKTIYWKDDNLLGIHSVVGIYSVVNLKSTNDEYIDDNYMTVRDMENLIKLVK